MVEDLRSLQRLSEMKIPTSLCFSLAQHGSFLLRQYLYKYPNSIDGAILAGTGIYEKLLVDAGILIIKGL